MTDAPDNTGEPGKTSETDKALIALAQEYIPRPDTPKPSTYANWWPPDPRWPVHLTELHAACVDARRAWARAHDARKRAGATDAAAWGTAATLQAIAYYALEREARAAIVAWLREWVQRHEGEGDPGAQESGQ